MTFAGITVSAHVLSPVPGSDRGQQTPRADMPRMPGRRTRTHQRPTFKRAARTPPRVHENIVDAPVSRLLGRSAAPFSVARYGGGEGDLGVSVQA